MTTLGSILSTTNIPDSSINAETPGVTVTINMSSKATLRTWTAGENETVNITGTQLAGQFLMMQITCDVLARTLTWGTGLKPSAATFILTSTKVTSIVWISDGSNFYMLSVPLTAL